jgi:hypothetical protein
VFHPVTDLRPDDLLAMPRKMRQQGLRCPRCGQPMRIIAFILVRPVIERILTHLELPSEPPAVLPARSPPQHEMPLEWEVSQAPGPGQGDHGPDQWPDLDQSTAPRPW